MIGRIVLLAIVGGATLGCAVTMLFSIGMQVPGAWHWAIPAAIGAAVTVLLRSRLPHTAIDEEPQ